VPSDSKPRERVGKYAVVRQLGEGAMGTVYLAHDPNLDRHVAVKMIRRDILGGKQATQMLARFRNEAMAAGRLQHPGIVSIYDYFEDDSTSFIVMEYAPGEDLDDYASRRAPLGLADIGSIMLQLLDALDYAHASGVVHRDIKPSNLIVSSGGRVKITDFGIARIASSTLTQTGTALGTPMYMAPEQYTGIAVDPRADLFSAGILLYELVTGARPFPGQSVQEVAYKICHTDPIRPTAQRAGLPPAVDGIVLNALAKDRAARFATAVDFAAAVAEVFGGAKPLAAAVQQSAVFTSWSPDAIRRLEAALLPYAGPLAPALVRRSVAKTQDANELVEILRRGAGGEAENPALLRDVRAALDAAAPAAPALTAEELERAAQLLVAYVGPIAKVLVKKAAAQATGWKDLCARLAQHLATDEERGRFLKAASAR
jgi:serine/threonine-protein kinase